MNFQFLSRFFYGFLGFVIPWVPLSAQVSDPSEETPTVQAPLPVPSVPAPMVDAAQPPRLPPGKPTPTLEEVKKRIQKGENGWMKLGEIRFNPKSREIRLPAEINMRDEREAIEYLLCHEQGKLHESLLSTPVSPFDLQVVMLLSGYEPSLETLIQGTEPVDSETPLPRNRVKIALEWTPSKSKEVRVTPIEDWVYNSEREKIAAKDGAEWVFTGSSVRDNIFLAEQNGSIISLYVDTTAMINNPRPGQENDKIWRPAPGVPEIGTPVQVVLNLVQVNTTTK